MFNQPDSSSEDEAKPSMSSYSMVPQGLTPGGTKKESITNVYVNRVINYNIDKVIVQNTLPQPPKKKLKRAIKASPATSKSKIFL